MGTEVVMPQLGYDMKEGRIVRWLRKEGETVQRGQPIAEIETDKANIEMEAFGSGVLRKILVPEGAKVSVGVLIGYIAAPEEPLPPSVAQPSAVPAPAAPTPTARATAAAQGAPPQATPAPAAPEVRVSPLARRLAQEKGIDLSRIAGTGPEGRIVERDVETFLAGQAATPVSAPLPPAKAVELSRMRQAIARLTARSKQEIPHFYVTAEIDMTAAMEFREQLNQAVDLQGARVSVNDLLVKSCALALTKYPVFNAFFIEGRLQLHESINIGIAIALGDEGLVVPAVLECEKKTLIEIAKATRDLIERAHQRHLREQEYTSATFSISNLGAFEIESFAAIIYPPQSAVLAVGAVHKQPVVRGDRVEIGRVMKATLSADHRVADGAQAAQLLTEIKRLLEHPASLMAAP